ncbi:TonB-dependent receptor [uncultured Parasphingopyxis sp.]|uniref:TonB-dependent receptor n=1 Tax=uncultured Parasphingopyxis sp. TaxID=1547918 RepID=UPI00260EA377|nr:TonB-dependent receptor [uncultured Parasphingopyxis sp.]
MANTKLYPALWVIAVATMASPALAQNDPTTPDPNVETDEEIGTASGIDVIVVTANKREESLQDVALAISAIGGDSLAERGIDDISNLQSYVPNLHVGQEQDGFKISLRGIGIQGTSSITDSGVAYYADNFYLSRPAGGSAVFYDVNRVEVLRGPQGTLYGRNATGGVVNVISNEPSDVFEGEIGGTYGSRDLLEVRGFVNVPFGEVGAARLSAVYSREDGYVRNLGPGDDLYGSDGDITVRGQLRFGEPESIEVLLYGLYSDLNGTGTANQFLERNFGGPPPTQALLRTIPADITDPLTTNIDALSFNDTETFLTFGRLTKEFGNVEAFLQVGGMWQDTHLQQDFDGSPVDVAIFNKDQENEAQSVELRFSSIDERPFSWIVGGYYFNEDTYIFRRVRLNGLTPGGVINLPDFLLDENGSSSTIAAFASVTVPITDEFRFTGGIRYTHDEKDGSKVTRGNFGAPFPPDLPNAQFPADVSFNRVNWSAALEYDVTPDILLYGRVSTGYKSGGFNLTSDGQPYDPEDIMAYEIGLKSDLFNGLARVNVDAFYYDYTDLQLTSLGVAADGVTPGQFTQNAAASTIWGIEIDTQWQISDEFLFTAAYTYLNAEFDEYFNRDSRFGPGPTMSLAGFRLPYVSEHSVNIGLQYETYIGDGTFTAAVNTNFHSDFFLREFNDPEIDRVESNTRTDITVSYEFSDPGLRITGYVTNLEDNVERNNIYLTPGFIGVSATTAYTRPRTFGVRADFSF